MNLQEAKNWLLPNGIRNAVFEDIPEMVRINIECWKHNYKGIIEQEYLDALTPWDKLENWKERFLTGIESYYVKVIDGKVVGMVSWWKNDDATIPYENEIYGLYVDIRHQGKHIGKELCEQLLQDERFKDCWSFYLWTLKDNNHSRHFYEKMWGKVFGEFTHRRWYALIGYCRQK